MVNALIVDDDIDIGSIVGILLAHNGITSNCIHSGREFKKALMKMKPDIIIMDVFLGDNDGRELCSELKKNVQLKNIPVLLYSAAPITAESIEHSHADGFIRKPFDLAEMMKKVFNLLKKNF